jgi:hypothetical protein
MSFRPVKPREPGTTAGVLGLAYRAAGGVKQIAFWLARSATQVYAYADGDDPAQLTLDDARRIASASPEAAAVFAEDFCAFAGGFFVPAETDVHEKLGELLARGETAHGKCMAALLARIGAARDAALSAAEQRELRRDILDIVRPLAAALSRLPEPSP